MGFSSPRKTERGFEIIDFDDFNQVSCSLQQSSIVGEYDDSLDRPGTSCIWLGINPSNAADTRTCDVSAVTKEMLLKSSGQHIEDVGKALAFFQQMLTHAAVTHDRDKLTEIDHFYSDFKTKFEQQGWWTNHRKINRHHLNYDDGVPNDVNLVDVLEYISDCVMAGMARSGSVYELKLPEGLLELAFKNTVSLLISQVQVES